LANARAQENSRHAVKPSLQLSWDRHTHSHGTSTVSCTNICPIFPLARKQDRKHGGAEPQDWVLRQSSAGCTCDAFSRLSIRLIVSGKASSSVPISGATGAVSDIARFPIPSPILLAPPAPPPIPLSPNPCQASPGRASTDPATARTIGTRVTTAFDPVRTWDRAFMLPPRAQTPCSQPRMPDIFAGISNIISQLSEVVKIMRGSANESSPGGVRRAQEPRVGRKVMGRMMAQADKIQLARFITL